MEQYVKNSIKIISILMLMSTTVIKSKGENILSKNQQFEIVIDNLFEKIKYIVIHYPLHIVFGLFLCKQTYKTGTTYYNNLLDRFEDEKTIALEKKIERFLIENIPNYEKNILVIDKAYEKAINNIKTAINNFPAEKIPSDLQETIEKLKKREEAHSSKKPDFTEEMNNNFSYYMSREYAQDKYYRKDDELVKKITLSSYEYYNVWMSVRKRVMQHVLETSNTCSD